MAKYVCRVCGFIYDEEQVNPAIKWDDLDTNWVCPICKAPKSAFQKLESEKKKEIQRDVISQEWNDLEMSILLSNLAKGCEKQYLAHEQALFQELSNYYLNKTEDKQGQSLNDLLSYVQGDLDKNYPLAHDGADQFKDRGAKRALVWSEKSTNMLSSLLERYQQEKENFVKDTKVFVCEICGFVSIGDEPPEICPVCKVPRLKIHEVKRGVEL